MANLMDEYQREYKNKIDELFNTYQSYMQQASTPGNPMYVANPLARIKAGRGLRSTIGTEVSYYGGEIERMQREAEEAARRTSKAAEVNISKLAKEAALEELFADVENIKNLWPGQKDKFPRLVAKYQGVLDYPTILAAYNTNKVYGPAKENYKQVMQKINELFGEPKLSAAEKLVKKYKEKGASRELIERELKSAKVFTPEYQAALDKYYGKKAPTLTKPRSWIPDIIPWLGKY